MSDSSPDPAGLREAISSGDPARAMPALAALRDVAEDQAIPLLLLGLEQSTFLVRSLACAGLGVAGPQGCTPLHSNTFDPDEGCLEVGVRVLTLSLLRWMETGA